MSPLRRLPINVPPARHETLVSYANRLTTLHGLDYADFWRQLSTARSANTSLEPVVERLSRVTGRPAPELAWALPELRRPAPNWRVFRHEPQPTCPACAARHPGGPVFVILPHHHYVCTRHRYWIGPPDTALPLPTLNRLPEIVAAQHHHHRLLHRHGWAATYDAILTGFMICGWYWEKLQRQPDHSMIGDTFDRWITRTTDMIPPAAAFRTFTASKLFAATYPEAVSIATLIASPHWRNHATGTIHQKRRFITELAHRLRWPDYQPKTVYDPIAHWMEYDAGRPPSQPPKTFNAIRGYNTPSQLIGHYEGKLGARSRSALWFGRNNKGGNTILNHRHIRPVVVRDWSPPMAEFAGAIWASQSIQEPYTRQPQTARHHPSSESNDNYLPEP